MKKQIVLATTFALVLSSLYCPESGSGETKIVKNQINFNGRKDSQAQS